MNLKLKRPIIFFDLETTGVDAAKDRIVEISMVKIDVNGEKQIKTRRINPEMPIPAEATAVHGITDDDVKDEPTFKQIAKSLAKFIEGCDFGGFNSNRFDLPVLVEEFMRAEVDVNFSNRKFVDVQSIFHKKEQRTLVAAYKFYCNKDLENAHSAEADTLATYEVLEAQIERYGDIGSTVEELAVFSSFGSNVDFAGRIALNDKGEEIFTFGKYKGRGGAHQALRPWRGFLPPGIEEDAGGHLAQEHLRHGEGGRIYPPDVHCDHLVCFLRSPGRRVRLRPSLRDREGAQSSSRLVRGEH